MRKQCALGIDQPGEPCDLATAADQDGVLRKSGPQLAGTLLGDAEDQQALFRPTSVVGLPHPRQGRQAERRQRLRERSLSAPIVLLVQWGGARIPSGHVGPGLRPALFQDRLQLDRTLPGSKTEPAMRPIDEVASRSILLREL